MTALIVLTVLGVLAVALAFGVWVGLALYAVGLIGLAVFRGHMPIDKMIAQFSFNVLTTPRLVALPLFVLMAEILFRSKLSASLFSGVAPWTARLPGRLLHVNVLGCILFAAISGSSARPRRRSGGLPCPNYSRAATTRTSQWGLWPAPALSAF